MSTQNTTKFGRHTSLTNATVSSVRTVLVQAFASNDFFGARMIAKTWKSRCQEGHDAASRILPIVERALVTLTQIEAGQTWAFEG